MCEEAEKFVKGNYHALFINKDRDHHSQLSRIIEQRGWQNSAEAILGDSTILLRKIPSLLHNQTVFLYLDPFGLKGCEFSLLAPFLQRNPKFSTEILLTMNMTLTHRLATRHVDTERRQNDPKIKSYNQRMTEVFGGDYWQDIMRQGSSSTEEREKQLLVAYRRKLAEHLPFTGNCPVREKTDTATKYFMVFASRHKDAMLLLNDIMAKAYHKGMHRADFAHSLWEHTNWREMQPVDDLEHIILDLVAKYPGETRELLWSRVVQAHFMRYLRSEYIEAVKRLINEKKLTSPTPRKTKQLNDSCTLYLHTS